MSPAAGARHHVDVDGRELTVSNLDKVLYPATGFTKGAVIDYYRRIAPVMLAHLAGRPITLHRFPNGVDEKSFYEKNCPSHRPDWMRTVTVTVSARKGDVVNYCLLEHPADLVWTANMASLELHPGLAVVPDLDKPTCVVFDLDPGPPADVLTCAEVAGRVHDLLEQLGLQAVVKTSGSKGLQVYVPLNTEVTFDQTREFALAVGQLLERDHPKLVLTNMTKELRAGKVFIDWSQNVATKTTIAVYSLRARERPTVSTPVTWEELEDARRSGRSDALRFEASDVLDRVQRHGDLFAPVLELQQQLPVGQA